MTHKETVEAYIREQIPELMELSFGCGIEFYWEGCGTGMSYEDYPAGNRYIVWSSQDDEMTDYELGDLDKQSILKAINKNKGYEVDMEMSVKIIGHPIHLEHVLRVLDAKDEHLDLHFWGDGRIEVLAYNDENLVRIQVLLPLISPDTWPEETWEQLSDLLGLSK